MLRTTALLVCLTLGTGCQSSGNSASFAPFGATRVPAPSTGSAGQTGSYYAATGAAPATGANAAGASSADRRVASSDTGAGWSSSDVKPSATIRSSNHQSETANPVSPAENGSAEPPPAAASSQPESEGAEPPPSGTSQSNGARGKPVELTDLPRPRVRIPTTNSARFIQDPAVTPAAANIPVSSQSTSDSGGWVAPAGGTAR